MLGASSTEHIYCLGYEILMTQHVDFILKWDVGFPSNSIATVIREEVEHMVVPSLVS